MRVTFSPRALRYLHYIAGYLIPRSRQGAAAVERRLKRVIRSIETFPGSGRMVEKRPSVRVMPLGKYPYVVFYTVENDEVIVLHIRHTARSPIDPDDL